MRQPQLRRASHLVRQLHYGRLPEDGHPPPNNENDLDDEDKPPKKMTFENEDNLKNENNQKN